MATIVPDVTALPLAESRQPIYDRPVGLAALHRTPGGAVHYVVRYPPGMTATRHTHSAAHTIIVLSGELIADGQRLGPGGYAHFPAGDVMHHEPDPELGCTFVTIFDGPFDVTPTP